MENIYQFFKKYVADDGIFYALLLILIGVASFGLGRWSVVDVSQVNQPASIVMTGAVVVSGGETDTAGATPSSSARPGLEPATTGTYVGSKNGTKYHLPYCPGAQQMKEENKVWFSSKQEAESNGYTAAANCPGL